eukprot:15443622-Alexandrium_andersonii.AAC.1
MSTRTCESCPLLFRKVIKGWRSARKAIWEVPEVGDAEGRDRVGGAISPTSNHGLRIAGIVCNWLPGLRPVLPSLGVRSVHPPCSTMV